MVLIAEATDIAGQLAAIAGILGAVAGVLAAAFSLIKVITDYGLGIKQKDVTKIVTDANLAQSDREHVLKALKFRLVTIYVLGAVLLLIAVLNYVAYRNLFPPRIALPKSFGFQSVSQISPSADPWLTKNPIFSPAVLALIPDNEEKRQYTVVRGQTTAFSTATNGNPTKASTASLKVGYDDFSLESPMVFLVHKGSTGDSYESLPVQHIDGDVSVTIPPSDPDTSILVIGAIQAAEGVKLPKELSKALKLEVISDE